MSDNRQVLREISWRDLCAWLLLFRTFRLAVSLPLLTLGTLAAVAIPAGWRLSEYAFLGPDRAAISPEVDDWAAYRRHWPGRQFDLETGPGPLVSGGGSIATWLQGGAVLPTYREGIQPLVELLRADEFRPREWAYLLSGVTWTLLVWGLFGGAINRVAVVRLGCEQAVGFSEALRFSRRRIRSYVFAPLMLLGGAALACVPGALLGTFMSGNFGLILAGACWLLALLLGFVMVALLAGVGLGWPLMWGAISAEQDGDEFEAINRSFSFSLGRPLHFLFYLAIVSAVGVAGSWVVDTVARSSISAARWSASWGAGHERWQEIQRQASGQVVAVDAPPEDARPAEGEEPAAAPLGLTFIDFSEDFARTIAIGFRHSFFWCAAAGVYLLLRRDCDETELDEVHLEDLELEPKSPKLEDLGPVAGSPASAPPASVAAASEKADATNSS